MNIVLIGFRCSGKTTLGKALAERLGMKFVDADELVEQKHRMTIKEIFEKKGESVFRLWECDAIAEIAKLDGHVIATGGGAVLRYKNIHNLKRNSVVVSLSVAPDTAYERIQRDPKTRSRRPPLGDKDPHTEVREQCHLRAPIYASVADVVLDTTDLPVGDCVDRILEQLQRFKIGREHPESEPDA
jgi:shikimate kinase